jgi:GNAT superfamily N-acetyltransferase
VSELRDLTLVPFRVELADELVAMWRASFERGVGVIDPHPPSEQRACLLGEVLSHNSVRVALAGGRVIGFVAASDDRIAQLYVHLDYQGRGIGTLLLDWAKAQSAGKLSLFTFARNARACAFYECNGFVAVARGFEPVWQLEDVSYEWSAPSADAGADDGVDGGRVPRG